MSITDSQLLSGAEVCNLEHIMAGLYGLIALEDEVNPIRQRPMLQQHPDLLDRIKNPPDSSGRWAYTLYLIKEKGALSAHVENSAKVADWIVHAFDAGRASVLNHRDLAFRYLCNYDHLFHMIQWRDLNHYVRFKSATAYPIRNRVERIGEETEENFRDLGDPPKQERLIKLVLNRHYLRFAQVRPDETTTERYIAQTVVEACNLGLLYQSIREETPLLAKVHALYMT